MKNIAELTHKNRPNPTEIIKGWAFLFLAFASLVFTGNAFAQLVPSTFTPYACNTGSTANTIEPGQACSGNNVNNHTCADFGYVAAGSGATISITANSSGVITAGAIVAGGSNYNVNDILVIEQSTTNSAGEKVSASGGFFTVTAVNGTAVTAISFAPAFFTNAIGGINYNTATGLPTTDLGPYVGCNSDCLSFNFSDCPASTGTTVTAASCNYTDVQNAINSAVAGDTVLIPPGTCTWTYTAIKPSKVPMTIEGSGAGITTIVDGESKTNDNPATGATFNITASGGVIQTITMTAGGTQYAVGEVIEILQSGASGGTFTVNSIVANGVITSISLTSGGTGYTSANNVFTSTIGPWILDFGSTVGGLNRLTNMTVQGGTTPDPDNKGVLEFTGNSESLRIDHMALYPTVTAAFEFEGFLTGVVDHNNTYFIPASAANAYGSYVQHGSWDNVLSYSGGYGDGSWADPLYLGTEKAIYFENNTYQTSSSSFRGVAHDGWTGQRVVYRYETMENTTYGNHGTESPGLLRGARSYEWYDNTSNFTGTNLANAMDTRSGNGVIYDNIVNGNFNEVESTQEYRDYGIFSIWGQCNGTGPYDVNSLTSGSPTIFTSGTATASNSNASYPVLTDSNQDWTSNEWLGYSVINTSPGNGATINITASGGVITGGTINTAGTGYIISDVLTIVQGGGTNGTFKVTGILKGGGAISSIALVTGGSGYITANSLSTSAVRVAGLGSDPSAIITPGLGSVTANTATSITGEINSSYNNQPALNWTTGNNYVVTQATICIDQTGRGQGDLLTRNKTTGAPTVLGWPNQALEPAYSWNNEFNGVNVGGVIHAPAGSHIKPDIDYYNNVQAPGYVPYVYPHSLALLPLTISTTGNGLSVSGSIAASCTTNSDCSQGQTCSSGQCSPNDTFNCPASSPNVCSETIDPGNPGNPVVTLTATPASGAIFTGWTVTGPTGTSGADCAGTTGTCTLTMSAAASVTANFVTTDLTPPSGVQYGDVNGAVNGEGQPVVTIADAELTAQAVIGLITLTPAQQQAAMVSSKTETQPSIYDAFLIAEYAVGKITEFPVQQGT